VLLFLMLARASDVRVDPVELRDGADGTLDVRYGALVPARYTRDGTFVTHPPAWPVAERLLLLVSGGGNQATVDPTGLVVTGARPCRLPLEPGAEAAGELRVAVSASHVALTNAEGALLVDLARCAPVASRGGEGWSAPGAIGLGSWGLVALAGGTASGGGRSPTSASQAASTTRCSTSSPAGTARCWCSAIDCSDTAAADP